MDTNTHTKKCGDFFCSAAAIYYGQVERLSEYERNMRCTPFMVIDWYHPVEMKIETVTWMESIKKIQEIGCEFDYTNVLGYNKSYFTFNDISKNM